MPYYVYEVREDGPTRTPEFESLQDTLAGYGASLELYWPERTGGQSYFAVAAARFEEGIARVLDAYTDGPVTFISDGIEVEAAFPTPLEVCAGCGASPPRHISNCLYGLPDRIAEDADL